MSDLIWSWRHWNGAERVAAIVLGVGLLGLFAGALFKVW